MTFFAHQSKSLEMTAGFNRTAYFHDMGLGKTFTGGEKAMSFGERIVVVCQKSKIKDWIDHFKEHYGITPFDLTNKRDYSWFFGFEWGGENTMTICGIWLKSV